MPRTTDDISAELLVLRCRRGDPQGWNELVAKFHDRLFYFVRRMVEDDDRAQSLMQDVWMQVLRGLGRLQRTDRLTAWLYTIARRAVLLHHRRNYAAPDVAAFDAASDVVDPEVDAAAVFENAELVHFGLSRIGLAEREVLTLHFLEDFSVAEIAEILEIPPGTVKSRLARARSELRCVLERDAGMDESKVSHR
jgi:RNA polymerase sigma-70 factor (ECF subfamily)